MQRPGKRRYLSAACACLALAGCKVGPDYKAPRVEMPPGWAGPTTRPLAPSTSPATAPAAATTQPASLEAWWTQFNDPLLDSLVDRAIRNNLDIAQAMARLRQARAARRVAGSALWPTADVSASYTRSGRGSGDSGNNGFGSSGSRDRNLYQAGLDAAWELDVFGGARRDIESAAADEQAALDDARDVLVSLTSEVALDYVTLRGFQRQIDIAESNLEAQNRSLELTRRKQVTGFVGMLDVANAEALVASTRTQIPVLQAGRQQTIYALSVLLGLEPGALVSELSPPAPLPQNPPRVPAGLPSDLLLRRPDVRRAEAQLHSAVARVGVATADLFPRFSLTGSLGIQGNKPGSLTDRANHFWSIGPSISWPIFSAGRIRANIAQQRAAVEEALLAYRSSVLTALLDVENALIGLDREQAHRSALLDAVAANRRAVELATRLYSEGETDFLNVLSAQRSLYSSEDALVQSDRDVATNLIALYKALGGGW